MSAFLGWCVVVRQTGVMVTFFGPFATAAEAETYAAKQRGKKPARTAEVSTVSNAVPIYLLSPAV